MLGISHAWPNHDVGRHGFNRGRLIFSADDDGDLIAFDEKSGKDLWHFYMGANLHASPMTFSADDRQYITIAAGTDLFTFGLMDQ